VGDGPNESGLSRRHITMAVEDSLRRLGTDHVDVYFFHRFDPNTPIEESLRAVDDLVHQGEILYPAVSNWAAWQITKALGISAREGLARFECIQPMYNLAKRQAEVEILPLAQAEQMGVTPYSPLGGGLLTGKYGVGQRPERGRLVENEMYMKRYGLEQLEASLAAAEVKMTDEWRTEISALSVEPPPATDRLEEKSGIVYQGAKQK
jgi:aryl-alcohol dehydrogenase-like predicted oxidoreductase